MVQKLKHKKLEETINDEETVRNAENETSKTEVVGEVISPETFESSTISVNKAWNETPTAAFDDVSEVLPPELLESSVEYVDDSVEETNTDCHFCQAANQHFCRLCMKPV